MQYPPPPDGGADACVESSMADAVAIPSCGVEHVHKTRDHPGYITPPVLRSVCAYPKQEELAPFVSILHVAGVTRVTSIGAGEGWVEGLLEMSGLEVTCVDIDVHARFPELYDSFATYTRRGVVVRLPYSSAVYAPTTSDPRSALLFAFGKRVPFDWYAENASAPIIAVIGDPAPISDETCVTQPSAYCLASSQHWQVVHDGPCRAVMEVRLVVYARRQADVRPPLI